MVEDNAHAKALGAVFWCFLSEKLGIRFHYSLRAANLQFRAAQEFSPGCRSRGHRKHRHAEFKREPID